MERTYAGILGLTAFAATVGEGVYVGATAQAVLGFATVALILFAAIGGLLGWLASRTVDESVRAAVARELTIKSESKISSVKPRSAVPGSST